MDFGLDDPVSTPLHGSRRANTYLYRTECTLPVEEGTRSQPLRALRRFLLGSDVGRSDWEVIERGANYADVLLEGREEG